GRLVLAVEVGIQMGLELIAVHGRLVRSALRTPTYPAFFRRLYSSRFAGTEAPLSGAAWAARMPVPSAYSRSVFCSSLRPRKRRLITVPTGHSRISAISL